MEELVCAVLNNGVRIPAIGYAVTCDSMSDELALRTALDSGFRFLDTDAGSGNEGQLGAVLQDYTKRFVPREDLFVSTKVVQAHAHMKELSFQFRQSLHKLHLSAVDLLYLAIPPIKPHDYFMMNFDQTANENRSQLLNKRLKEWRLSETDLLSIQLSPYGQNDIRPEQKQKELLEAWKALADLSNQGLARSIGLANASLAEVKAVTEGSDVKPAVVQVHQCELVRDSKLLQYCREQDIHLVVHLDTEGNIPGGFVPDNQRPSFKNKSTNQVLGRFYLENNVSVVIHEKDPARIQHAFKMLDFSVSIEELSTLKSRRLVPNGF